MTEKILECKGYLQLLAAVEKDIERWPNRKQEYRETLDWAVQRAEHYAEKTGLNASEILDAWEKQRNYWYMNYYQNSNQPKITAECVRVFETSEELQKAIGTDGFRCPLCGEISTSPYECNSGKVIENGKVCDWKVYGLFKDLGKGVYVFVKDQVRIELIFMPVAWEDETPNHQSLP